MTRIKATRPVPDDALFMNKRPIIDLQAERIISLTAETQFTPNGIVSRTLTP